ncbi:DNA replication/repair protein RecF [Caviibacter abscessus]|uniref:DNA replication/repair protein RecF n=1 Tax=Caviibacter abscessus TaxID=1766719 RepID=UPI00082A24DA|nr:DNA replication and repair protein RecF [Caviibacter abscessus]
MYLEELMTQNYRMLKSEKIKFDKKMNLIYGKNAQGKTSIIEAIYFIATGKSFRTKKNIDQIKHQEKRMLIFAKTNKGTYSLEFKNDKRNFYIDKNLVKYTDYIGEILCVYFIPEDIEIITGSPVIRRKFFNYEISQVDRFYLRKIINFQKVLKVRNNLLKEKDIQNSIFEIYEDKFIDLAVDIILLRNEYISQISEILQKKYNELFDKEKKVEIRYESFYTLKENQTREEIKKEIKEMILKKRQMELNYGYSQIGPQKDEYSFYIDNQRAKSFASQGEKKSIIFALKLSQIEYIQNMKDESPIFLIDDVASYFDEIRKNNILQYFFKNDIQCFLTSTQKFNINVEEMKEFEINEGEIIYES